MAPSSVWARTIAATREGSALAVLRRRAWRSSRQRGRGGSIRSPRGRPLPVRRGRFRRSIVGSSQVPPAPNNNNVGCAEWKILAALLVLASPSMPGPSFRSATTAHSMLAAHGEWKGQGLLGLNRLWSVSGWYGLPRNSRRWSTRRPPPFLHRVRVHGCARALGLRRVRARTSGAARDELCVRRGEVFEYKLDEEDPPACPDGYFTLPGTLVFEPDGDKHFEVTVGLDRDYIAGPRGPRLGRAQGRSADARARQHLADGCRSRRRGDRSRDSDRRRFGGRARGGAATVRERDAECEPVRARARRRANGNGLWYTADGDLLRRARARRRDVEPRARRADAAPRRRPWRSGRACAVDRGLASLALNQGTHISSEGRLEHDFVWNGGVLCNGGGSISRPSTSHAAGISPARPGGISNPLPRRPRLRGRAAFEEDAAGKLFDPAAVNRDRYRFRVRRGRRAKFGRGCWDLLYSLSAEEPVVTVR